MKKLFLSIAILASSVAAFAQGNTQTATDNSNAKTEQTSCDKKSKRSDCKAKKAKKEFKNREDRGARAFEGINLTEDQQTKLTALRANLKGERTDKKEGARKEEKSNLTSEQKQQMKADRMAKRQASKKAYLAGVKEILTPDQYVVFLENSFTINSPGHGQKAIKNHGQKDQQKGKAFRSDKSGKKGNRDQKATSKSQKRDKRATA